MHYKHYEIRKKDENGVIVAKPLLYPLALSEYNKRWENGENNVFDCVGC